MTDVAHKGRAIFMRFIIGEKLEELGDYSYMHLSAMIRNVETNVGNIFNRALSTYSTVD